MTRDADHLNLLSIFHYVIAGLVTLVSLVPGVYLVVALAILFGSFTGTDPGAQVVGCFFVLLPAIIMLCGLALAVAIFLAGRSLATRTRYTYCFVIAGIECMFVPFGTVLGVFTIVVLLRDSVKTMFGVEPPR